MDKNVSRNLNRKFSRGLQCPIAAAPGAQQAQRAIGVDIHPTTVGDATTTDATPAKNDTGMPKTPTGIHLPNEDLSADNSNETERGAVMDWFDELGS